MNGRVHPASGDVEAADGAVAPRHSESAAVDLEPAASSSSQENNAAKAVELPPLALKATASGQVVPVQGAAPPPPPPGGDSSEEEEKPVIADVTYMDIFKQFSLLGWIAFGACVRGWVEEEEFRGSGACHTRVAKC